MYLGERKKSAYRIWGPKCRGEACCEQGFFSLKPFTMLWSMVGKMDSRNGNKTEVWGLAPFPGEDWHPKAEGLEYKRPKAVMTLCAPGKKKVTQGTARALNT